MAHLIHTYGYEMDTYSYLQAHPYGRDGRPAHPQATPTFRGWPFNGTHLLLAVPSSNKRSHSPVRDQRAAHRPRHARPRPDQAPHYQEQVKLQQYRIAQVRAPRLCLVASPIRRAPSPPLVTSTCGVFSPPGRCTNVGCTSLWLYITLAKRALGQMVRLM
jgi:hypothetical protein